MKRIFTSILLFFTLLSFGQTNIPQLVSFSAVVRDANNQPLANTAVSLRLTFRQGGQTGPLVYCALHQDQTNQNGFISIQLNRQVLGVGCNGAPSTNFENIPWENGGFWMEVEYQTNPGSAFINLGQLELASNFYSFASGTAERLINFNIENANDGDIMIFNGSTGKWQPSSPNVTSGNQQISFSLTGDTLFLSNGGFVIIPGLSSANIIGQILTTPASNIFSAGAQTGGNISSSGLSTNIIQKGVCWSTSPNPTLNNNFTNNGSGFGTFSSNLTGLLPNTLYYYRAYAISSSDTAYGNDYTLTTSLIDLINITPFTWQRVGSNPGTGLDLFGLQWNQNTVSSAIITPLSGTKLVLLEPTDWDLIETIPGLENIVNTSTGLSSISVSYLEPQLNQVIGTKTSTNEFFLIRIESSTNSATPSGTQITFEGFYK